jgi:hypothetical protein
MRPQQAPGNGVLVPRARSSDHHQAVGKLGAVAEGALNTGTEATGPPHRIHDPGPLLERRAVADVLVVEAGQLRHPVPDVVRMEPDDRADHPPVPTAAGRWSHSAAKRGPIRDSSSR